MPKIFGDKGFIGFDQSGFLQYLAPHFAKARQEGKIEVFFEKLCAIWYIRYPTEFDTGGDDDPDYLAWLIKRSNQV